MQPSRTSFFNDKKIFIMTKNFSELEFGHEIRLHTLIQFLHLHNSHETIQWKANKCSTCPPLSPPPSFSTDTAQPMSACAAGDNQHLVTTAHYNTDQLIPPEHATDTP